MLGTVAIFTFMGEWNNLLGPLIYLNTADKQTLSIGVAMWQKGSAGPHVVHYFSHTMAISLLMSLPPVVVFFLTQRGFIQGVVISGVKG